MSAKIIFVVCAQVLLIKCALSQCAGRIGGAVAVPTVGLGPLSVAAPGCGIAGSAAPALGAAGLGYAGYGAAGLGSAAYGIGSAAPAIEYTATSGGAFPVSSASAVAPTGISVESENVYEGALSVAGELPFVGTVALEGVYATAGSGVVNHACGNGVTAITSDSVTSAPAIAGVAAYAPAAAAIAPAAVAYGPAAGLATFAPAATAISSRAAFAPAAYGAGIGCGALGLGNGLLI